MRVAGMMALNQFPLWRKAFDSLYELCDDIYVRFDGISGDPEILQELGKMSKEKNSKIRFVNIVKSKWSCPDWREECLALVNGATDKPDIVLCPDEDELFDNPELFRQELQSFWLSEKLGMMFSYNPLVSNDGRKINGNESYPPDPHMKAFKWKAGISYWPYHGNAQIGMYNSPACQWQAKTRINHLCAYTPAMQNAKHWRSDTPLGRGHKSVTMIGFGPSSEVELHTTGEVWSLNNCYQVFGPQQDLLKRVTRIFEMHMFSRREKEVAADGRLHFDHLNELGKLGHRIIMQSPHPLIAGSEAYPLYSILNKFPFKFFDGTPPYMLAMAIAEGFTEIRLYGFDQLDYEHRFQRECFVFWCGIAAGMGISLSGELTFLKESTRLYGYEYGPEFDEECQRRLWSSFPFELKMKIPSRAEKGKLYGTDI